MSSTGPGSEEPIVRAHLGSERRATQDRIEAMTADFDAIVRASSDANIDDEHDPEGSTVAFERAQVAALLAQARTSLDELDQALARLDAGVYFQCERCGAPIGNERLTARPASRTCIGCASPVPPSRGPG
jgi:RNA polymerase-binding transcription factor DksA